MSTQFQIPGAYVQGTGQRGAQLAGVYWYDVTVVGSTLARPVSDIAAGAWTPSSGGDLFAMVDEPSPPSDADYISTSIEAACTLALSNTGGTRDGHILRLRAWSPAADGLTAEILQGASVIATRSIANLPVGAQTYEFALTAPEIADITDYSTLRVRLTAVNATDSVTYVDPDYVDFDYVD